MSFHNPKIPTAGRQSLDGLSMGNILAGRQRAMHAVQKAAPSSAPTAVASRKLGL